MSTHTADKWSSRSILVVIACAIGNIVGLATIIGASFSLFLDPVSKSLGWERSDFSFVLALLSIVGVIAYPLSGWLIDRLGTRSVALAGNVLFGLSVACLAFMSSSHLVVYSMFIAIGLVGALPSTVLMARVVSTWFYKQRGLALGLSGGAAFGLGGAVIPVVAEAMIDEWGWRGAFVGLGAFVILVGFPVFLLLLKEAPNLTVEQTSAVHLSGLSRREAFRTPAFWLLMMSVSLGGFGVSAIVTYIPSIVTDRGDRMATALASIAGFYFMNAAWQIVLGLALDRVATPKVAALFNLLGIAGVVLFWQSHNATAVVASGFLIGLSSGTEYGLLPFCIVRYFGFRAYGEIYGWMFGVIMLTQGAAPYVMGLVVEATGSYTLSMVGICVMIAMCSAMIALLPKFEARIRDQTPRAVGQPPWGGVPEP